MVVEPTKIVCVGRAYAAHAAEMGAERLTEPLLFLKPPSALLAPGDPIVLPAFSAAVHHEVEMVLRIGRRLRAASAEEAQEAGVVDAVAVGLDLTARDLQSRAKERGHPWAVAKGFDGAAPLGSWAPLRDLRDLQELDLELRVNGEVRQSGNTRDLLWSPAETLAFISSRFTLEAGDLVFTGTPEGVGPLVAGDRVEARLGALSTLAAEVRRAG